MPLDLGAPADRIIALAGAVTDDQLSLATPCGDQDVATVLAHIIGFSTGFRDGAAKVKGPTTSTPPGPMPLADDWREQLPERVGELVTAWRDPAAWEGETMGGGVIMPAAIHGGFANNELVIHGWDLAVATGQPYDVAAENLEAAWELVSGIPEDPDARAGLFGPRVPVPDDAPMLDRTLAYAGRNPNWMA
jgi:uncharacterized protein (TIGR03086 family)